jgi:hypothetical protein
MCLLPLLLRCLAVVGYSRFGEINSRLGRFEFPVIAATLGTEIRLQGLKFVDLFRAPMAVARAVIDKIPVCTGKTGNFCFHQAERAARRLRARVLEAAPSVHATPSAKGRSMAGRPVRRR